MKFYQSIRFRIVFYVLLFGTILVVLNAGITFFIMGKGLSGVIENLLSTEADYFLYKYKKDKTTALPHSKYIKVFKGISMVPEKFREKVKVLPPGIYDSLADNSKRPFHIAVMAMPDTKTPYYMFFHGKEFMNDNFTLRPHHILLISLSILLIPGVIIGYLTARMLFKPVVRLMDKIKTLNPEDIPEQFSEKHYTNEIGVLTRTIENTMGRIKEFIQREKQFTRDASHELRTPLTIVKGAVEIMEQQPEIEHNTLLKRPLKRISRSVSDMEITIETFLWLAREEDHQAQGNCRVADVVKRSIENNKYLIEKKDVTIHVDVQNDQELNVKEEVLSIAVTNLVRNAFHFTADGSVTILITRSFIEISDTGAGIEKNRISSVTEPHFKGEESQGFGLGLNIVERLCDRFGWVFEIDSQKDKGTRVKILYATGRRTTDHGKKGLK